MSTFSENRGIARNYIPGLIKTGYSGRGAEKWLKGMGVSYKRQDFTNDWRELSGREKKKGAVKYIRKDYKPTVSTLSDTQENLSEQYCYITRSSGTDTKTGEYKEIIRRYKTEELESMGDVEALIERRILENKYEENMENITVLAEEVLTRARL